MWVMIFQYTIFLPNPSLALSTVSSNEYNPSTFTSHSLLHFPHTQGHPLLEYRRSMRTMCDLTLVCGLWWTIEQEGLLELVWLTKRGESARCAPERRFYPKRRSFSWSRCSRRASDEEQGVAYVDDGETKRDCTRSRLRWDQRLSHHQRFLFHISTTSLFVIVSNPPSSPPFLEFLCNFYRRLRVHLQHSRHRATHASTAHRTSLT
ncbi:hypothetical protein BKA70DRAFT_681715 [Coprinopsis sp. MPI-PUGE-AT-0042]|nr:hypothetical protein BKA70DRAFT_681715 [Coprinopsis sp. MPI-PUGE-AT-0042]